jgi:hypothetical protein
MQRYTVYLYLETALHVSGGTSTHHQERIQLYLQHLVFVTVTAICRYRGRVGTGLSVLWVAYASLAYFQDKKNPWYPFIHCDFHSDILEPIDAGAIPTHPVYNGHNEATSVKKVTVELRTPLTTNHQSPC